MPAARSLSDPPTTRVAVTGLGVICSLGSGQTAVWEGLMQGRSGIGKVRLAGTEGCLSDRAGHAPADGAPRGPREGRLSRRDSRSDRLCLAAAREAVAQAGLGQSGALADFGVSLGSSTAGMLEAERYCQDGARRGFHRARPSRVLRLPSSAPADAVARLFGAAGPRLSNMTACASSAASIGFAADLIRSGEAPGMLAGGGDALCLLTYTGFNALRLHDPQPCRPFDAARQGLSLGEGAGILVLEDWDRAAARGARPLAEFVEYGASCDASHMTAPHPEGRGALAAMSEALHRAGLPPERVGHVNAHGTGTSLNDATEARALTTLFAREGRRAPPLTASKSSIGHLLGGAGAVEAAIVVLTLMHGRIPPTLGFTACDEGTRLDVVAGCPRELPGGHALSNSFGFGGTNYALLFKSSP
ncbi:MAG TPA: beta-ketoacyl-[acyl-carrier-protein] synthase family protein [Candidatus Polarisedimenticolia bacterium]|nr:beta-ketoacyl-[acyl-carrier-protein] synthase family protein [Candidatus Polarisedimenticolia bacterium]